MTPSRLYAIADADALAPRAVAAGVAEMAAAGVRWIQVRAKGRSGSELYGILEASCRAVEGAGVELWIDDRSDLAALFPLAGVHLGQRDLPPAAARRALAAGQRIGLSTHDREQLAAAAADPEVAVVAVGPVYPTASKVLPDPVVGLSLVRAARAASPKTVVGIGGIDGGNLAAVLAAGADAVAVLGAVCRGDVRANCRRLLAAAAVAESVSGVVPEHGAA
jgi:thiamine-phosphate pyrophosphorylase